MATGSQATRRAARDAAGYRTGVSQGNRCDGCVRCVQAAPGFNVTKRDRTCTLHRVAVKTHGVCKRWEAA
jgi:hypothetical protein